MSKFKVGQYVMANIVGCPDRWVLGKVVKIAEDDIQVKLVGSQYQKQKGICYTDLRPATNDNYINTLTPKQKAKFFFDVAHGKTKINWYEYANQVHIDWLNSAYDGWRVEE